MNNKKFWVSVLALILVAAMVMGLVLMVIPTNVNAKSSSEIKDQIAEMEKQNEELEQRVIEAEAVATAAERERDEAKESLSELRRALSAVGQLMGK